MSIWIVLGSSPSAPQSLKTAREKNPSVPIITCNRGIRLVPTPDVYAIIDSKACELFGEEARDARKRGTLTVTLDRSDSAIAARGIEWIDMRIKSGVPWESFRMSGLWCMEYAIRIARATRLMLCGFEGYNPSPPNYWYESDEDSCKRYDINERVIQPATLALCEKYPDVEFCCFGQPKYTIDSPNWSMI